MKRTTVSLPDDLAAAAEREARRRRISVSQLTREALETKLRRPAGKREIPFAAIGRTGDPTIAERVEEILTEEWGNPRDR